MEKNISDEQGVKPNKKKWSKPTLRSASVKEVTKGIGVGTNEGPGMPSNS